MDPDVIVYYRGSSSLVSFLTAVGGFIFALKILGEFFVYLVTSQSAVYYLTSRLFMKQLQVEDQSGLDPTTRAKKVIENRVPIVIETISKKEDF